MQHGFRDEWQELGGPGIKLRVDIDQGGGLDFSERFRDLGRGALKRRSPQLDEPGIAPTAYTRLLQKHLWNAVKSEMFPDGSAGLRGKGREVGFREVNAISALPEGPRTCGENEAGLMLIAEKICEKLLPAGGELPVITEDNFTIIDKNDRATRRLGELVEAMIDPLWQRR